MATITPPPRLEAPADTPADDPAERYQLRASQWLVVGWALLVTLVFSTRVFNTYTTPKSALDLCVLLPGLVVLAVLCFRGDRAAWFGTAFLAVALAAVAFADVPAMSFFGEYFSQNGWLLLAVIVGAWALGRWLGDGMQHALATAIVAGAVINAAVGWLELSADLGIDGIAPAEGRAAGLLGNPVFLGAFLAGALWIVLDRERTADRPLIPLLLTALLVGAVQLSGSRIALALVLVTAVWFVARHWLSGRKARAGLALAAVVVGLALSALPSGSTASTTSRVGAGSSSGITPRIEGWRTALDAVVDQPVLGYGPGRYQVATTPRRPFSVVRYDGPDVLFSDAHNFLVEVLTTTGVIGFGVFAVWLGFAARRARGPLAGFVAVVGVTMLFEPLDVGLTPVVGLALGVAAAVPQLRAGTGAGARRAIAMACTVGVVIGAVAAADLVVGDMQFDRGIDTRSVSELARAGRRFPPWPQVPGARAAILASEARTSRDRSLRTRALEEVRKATQRDPSDPRWWASLGEIEAAYGTPRAAAAAYRRALALDPWSLFANAGLYRLARAEDQPRAEERYRRMFCKLDAERCPRARSTAPDSSPEGDQ